METLSVSFFALKTEMKVAGFDCGDAELNGFLVNDALAHQTQQLAQTSVAVQNGEIIGYVSLLCDAVKLGDDERASFDSRKRYAEYPAVKIGRMGVSTRYKGKGVGMALLRFAVGMAGVIAQTAGCRFLTVDAYPAANSFYERFGFANNLLKNKPGRRTVSKRFDLLNPKPHALALSG